MGIWYGCCFSFFSYFSKKKKLRADEFVEIIAQGLWFAMSAKEKTLCQLPTAIQSAGPQPTFDPTGLKALSLSLSHSCTERAVF